MICYSDTKFYYVVKLMFSTKQFKGVVSLNTNKNLYFASMGRHKYSQLAANNNRNSNSMAYLGVFK